MAHAKRCPCCGYYMFAVHEDRLRERTWISYVCRNHACRQCGGKCKHSEKQLLERARSTSLSGR